MNVPYSYFMVCLYAWMAIAFIVFLVLLRVTAPYGRHTTNKWGKMIDNRAGWLIMELPALLVMSFVLIKTLNKPTFIITVLVSFYCIHYLNRTIIFPFRLHTRGKKMPVVIVCSAVLFNLLNTFFLGYYFLNFAVYPVNWLLGPQFITGAIVFAIGMYINWKADAELIGLRKKYETHYSVPRGWMFEYVSCPNLMGELIEWAGFWILCWSMPAFCFFLWSAANLVPRALAHHSWYRNKFAEYPVKRKAVIPFIL